MLFESFAEGQSVLLWAAFGIALVMGAVVNKTNFCTMGAVSDLVNMGDMGRMRAWLFAIAVALLGVVGLESVGLADPGSAFPPYRASQLLWAEHLLGGIMFGIGMTLASGCGNKTLIRIGGGNLKSIAVFAVIAVIAYFMISPFPGSDQTLMSLLFLDWLRPMALQLDGPQDLGSIVGGAEGAATARLAIGGLLGIALLVFVFKSADFRGSFDNVFGGLVVGLAILAAWFVTSNIVLDVEGEAMSLAQFAQPANWEFYSGMDLAIKPDTAPLSAQSFTFINPIGQTLGYAASGFGKVALTFGVMAVFGVILGSFLWSILSNGFRFEWFVSFKDFLNHFVGAVLMGFGGVLAMGCTIGQGITGVSTLAIGSILTLLSIIFGSAMTMKIAYYKMVYEDEATFGKAFIAALADMRLLPNSLRQLEAV